MNRTRLLCLLAALGFSMPVYPQTWRDYNNFGAGAPTGSCSSSQIYINTSTGDVYGCNGGSWRLSGAGTNALTLNGATFAAPGAIGGTTPGSITATTVSASGQITSTVSTGTPPLVISSSTNIPNLNASSLNGATMAAPGAIGGTTPSTGAFTTISATGAITSTLSTGTAPFTISSTTAVANLKVQNLSAVSGGLLPSAAGGTDAGSTALPFGNLWLGTAATNNFKFQPGTTSGARIITITDPTSPTTVGLPLKIVNSSTTMVSGAIAAATCAAAVTTPATGALTTDSIEWTYATAPTLTTDALLHVSAYVTSGNVNFTRCNPTASSITGTAIVINWRVIR